MSHDAYACACACVLVCLLAVAAIVWIHKMRPPALIRNPYVISLPARKDMVRETLKGAGIHPRFVEPVMKDELDRKALTESGFLATDCSLNNGRIACHMSHLKTMRMFLDTREDMCVIFEDDIYTRFSKEEIWRIAASLERDIQTKRVPWDIIYLSKCWDKCDTMKKIGTHLYTSPAPVCRHAYVVTRQGAQKIIDGTSHMHKLPGDEMYRKMIKDGTLLALSCAPQLFWQNRQEQGVLRSNLGNNNMNMPECSTSNKTLSVVIMNYSRPTMCKYVVSKMAAYKNVSEILVLNNNKATAIHVGHPKVRCISTWDIHDTHGVATRFIGAQKYARFYSVLFVDDDVMVSNSYIKQLKNNHFKDPNNIYGYFKRVCNERDGYVHSTKKVTSDNYDTILTGVMLTSKTVVDSFVDNMHRAESLALDKAKAGVLWNGEDLFINMIVRDVFKKHPVYVHPKNESDIYMIQAKSDPKRDAISSMPNHYSYRDEFCKSVSVEVTTR